MKKDIFMGLVYFENDNPPEIPPAPVDPVEEGIVVPE